jgi:hypothetical protein
MFNIFAEALLIALQMGRPSDQPDRRHRRAPREFQDIEALNPANRTKHWDR